MVIGTSVIITGGAISIIGGATSFANDIYTFNSVNDVWQSNDIGLTWTKTLSTSPWVPRYGHSTIVYGNSIVLR